MEIRKPLQSQQVDRQLRKLERLGVELAIATIEHTIENGWVGLREPPDNGKHTGDVEF